MPAPDAHDPCKKPGCVHLQPQHWGGGDRRIPGTHWPTQVSQLQTWSQRNMVKRVWRCLSGPRAPLGFDIPGTNLSLIHILKPQPVVFTAVPAGSLAWEVRSERCSGDIRSPQPSEQVAREQG